MLHKKISTMHNTKNAHLTSVKWLRALKLTILLHKGMYCGTRSMLLPYFTQEVHENLSTGTFLMAPTALFIFFNYGQISKFTRIRILEVFTNSDFVNINKFCFRFSLILYLAPYLFKRLVITFTKRIFRKQKRFGNGKTHMYQGIHGRPLTMTGYSNHVN